MEIRARIALSLVSIKYNITLKYNTFEKASYDAYLIACLVKNTKTKKAAHNYIDEITGKGSLNEHFKNLYEKTRDFSKEQIDSIINSSLYPITKIDESNSYYYYPIFNVSKLNGIIYEGNLNDNIEFLKDMLMPKEDNVSFVSIDFKENEPITRQDTHTAIFNNQGIYVELEPGKKYFISKTDFDTIYRSDVENLNGYLGIVDDIEDIDNNAIGEWKVLNKIVVDSFSKKQHVYANRVGKHCSIENDFIRVTEIMRAFSLYFYKESRYAFIPSSKRECEDAIRYLINSNNILEKNIKSLKNILTFINDDIAQEAIQYILLRNPSKEIAESGLALLKKKIAKNWNKQALIAMKKFASPLYFNFLYKIDSDLDFSISDILAIDDNYLTDKDKERKKKYLEEKNNLIKSINSMIGEIATSGIREKIKPLPKSDLKARVKMFVDNRIGHAKKDYSSLSLELLKKEFEAIKEMYENDYPTIKKVLEEYKEK